MKWWKSVVLASASLCFVMTVSLFALIKTQVIGSNAAALPVITATKTNDLVYTADSFTEAKAALKEQGIALETGSRITLSYAKYQKPLTTDKDVLKAAKILSEEWSKYSNSTIKSSGLKKIYLVKGLSVSGQKRSGMPDPIYEDALYFDVSSDYIASEDGAYMRKVFHHEFKHLIDYNLAGSYSSDDKAWTACHAPNFSYGNGGPAMYANPDYAHKKHPVAGFVNGYATSGIEEDKAEVYALLMTDPAGLQLVADQDAQVSCKVSLTRTFVKSL